MDIVLYLKAGFMGFALSIGVQMLFFFIAGSLMKVTAKNFYRVFVLAAVAAFAAIYMFLHYKIRVAQVPETQAFVSACVGGWFAGIIFGFTRMKNFLLSLRR